MAAADNYCIKPSYRDRPPLNVSLESDGRQYWTSKRIHSASLYQFHVYRLARDLIRRYKAHSVLDLGCGTGAKAIELLQPICQRLVLIDQGTAPTTKLYPEAEFYAENLDAPRLDLVAHRLAGQFDLVVCADVIEHLPDPDTLLEWMKRLSTKDAYLIISTPERDLLRGSDCLCSPQPEHLREWNQAELRQYLSTRGFSVVDHFLLPAQRFNPQRRPLAFIQELRRRFLVKTCQVAICRVCW
jgi:SAM-dependent methyltransferase